MSKAFQGFEYAIKDADELLGHFDAVNRKPPLDGAEVLKRAGLVMALTAWETYVEDLLLEIMQRKLGAVTGSYVGDFVMKKLHQDLKQFHNPKYSPVNKCVFGCQSRRVAASARACSARTAARSPPCTASGSVCQKERAATCDRYNV